MFFDLDLGFDFLSIGILIYYMKFQIKAIIHKYDKIVLEGERRRRLYMNISFLKIGFDVKSF